jgi:hypothetical protein
MNWCENIKDAAERTNSDADNFINKIITNNESKGIQHFKDLSGESSNTYPSSSPTSQPSSENESATENHAFGRSAYIPDDCCVADCCVPFPNIQGMSHVTKPFVSHLHQCFLASEVQRSSPACQPRAMYHHAVVYSFIRAMHVMLWH